MRVSQPVRGLLWPWRRELGAERRGGFAECQTLRVVTHVHLFPVEDRPQVLGEGRVETDPGDESCEGEKLQNYNLISIFFSPTFCFPAS